MMTDQVSKPVYVCDDCGEEHRYPIAAAMCCDPICGRGID